MSKQDQRSGENSTNIQAGGNVVVNTGLTYADAKQIFLDLFRENFDKLAGGARETAQKRGEKINEEFLDKLQKENPSGVALAEDPDFQHALFTVQKEYARTGDEELGKLLVDLLIDRSKQQQRSLLQIVLNESLHTAPKLTSDQLATLAILFLFRYTQDRSVGNHELFGKYLDKYVLPFVETLSETQARFQHLEFSACGKIEMGEIKLETILSQTYHGLFLTGFDAAQFETDISIPLAPPLFVPCLNDPSKLQVRALNNDALDGAFEENGVPADDRMKISQLFNQKIMGIEEIRTKCIAIRPYMERLFDVWDKSSMKHFTLTSVGMAIGHANIKRLTGEFAPLNIWIN